MAAAEERIPVFIPLPPVFGDVSGCARRQSSVPSAVSVPSVLSFQNADRSLTMPRRSFFLFSSCCCSYAFALSPMIPEFSGRGMSVLNPSPCRSFPPSFCEGAKMSHMHPRKVSTISG